MESVRRKSNSGSQFNQQVRVSTAFLLLFVSPVIAQDVTFTYDSRRPVHPPKVNSQYQFEYDSDGNLKTLRNASTTGRLQDFTYNSWNHLSQVDDEVGRVIRYHYDSRGNRISKVSFAADGSTLEVHRYFGSIQSTNGNKVLNLSYGLKQIATRSSDGRIRFHHQDHINSAIAHTSPTGIIEQETEYYEFGSIKENTTEVALPYGFNGMELEPDTESYDFGPRSLNKHMFWSSPDSILPNAFDPQSLNPSSFVKGNPTSYWDPDGHQAESVQINNIADIPPTSSTPPKIKSLQPHGLFKRLDENGYITELVSDVPDYSAIDGRDNSFLSTLQFSVSDPRALYFVTLSYRRRSGRESSVSANEILGPTNQGPIKPGTIMTTFNASPKNELGDIDPVTQIIWRTSPALKYTFGDQDGSGRVDGFDLAALSRLFPGRFQRYAGPWENPFFEGAYVPSPNFEGELGTRSLTTAHFLDAPYPPGSIPDGIIDEGDHAVLTMYFGMSDIPLSQYFLDGGFSQPMSSFTNVTSPAWKMDDLYFSFSPIP